MQGDYSNILSPGYIGKMWIPNRIAMAPIGSLNGDPDGGYVTARNINYYVDKAQGGTGLIVVESTYPDDVLSRGEDGELGLANNSQTPGMTVLASAIHSYYGVKCAIQLCHIGKQLSLHDRCDSLGPSDMDDFGSGFPTTIRGMTVDEIHGVEEAFAQAAWRAKTAGFDAVEVHAANGHLLHMFIMPYYNARTDEYGGSIENRLRFTIETVKAIQERCGKDFPILVRFCGDDFDEGGVGADEAAVMATMLEDAGVAALDLCGGSLANGLCTPTMYDERGLFVPSAEVIKEAGVKIPIIVAGGITTPELAEQILAEGKADFIGLARPLLADPNWIKKLEAGAPEDIVPCIRCNMGCCGTMEEFNASRGLRCSLNPTCNIHEYRTVAPLKEKKKVAVIGGGPGGMEAARLATVRGHDVTLYEKHKLGGAMHEANFDTVLKSDIQHLIDYYRGQMSKLGVKVVAEEATADTIFNGGYDAVVVATGAVAKKSKIPGAEKPHVFSDWEVTSGRDSELGNTVIVVGGGVIAAEIAISQAMKGKKVILTTRRGAEMGEYEIAMDDSSPNWMRLLSLLKKYNVELNLLMNLKEVTDDGIISTDAEGNLHEFKGDNVVLCSGYAPNDILYKELEGKFRQLYKVGDCVEARFIGDAVHEGWIAANHI